ncbi:VOC family protein [Streptomyces shenzhenensis]|uniref:VOC family protein n=1 Tax=Streptomyces shenzhenensis TaxID=943815 RepID=UPI001F3CBFA7|nr:VOC family protein [Streptomyces shenzhenensis]
MKEELQLGYLVVGSTDTDAWDSFLRETIGLMAGPSDDDGTRSYRMDTWQFRVQIQPAEYDDIAAVGLCAVNPTVFARTVDRLKNAGVAVEHGDKALCATRRVAELVWFTAPGAVRVELVHSPRHAREPFDSPLVPGGFLTGAQGLGHAVFMVDDLAAARALWLDVLGFELSDGAFHETPSGEARALFLHCNRRHHSIALVQRPERSTYPKKLLHFMVQAHLMDSVGMAFDRALDAGLEIPRSLGRHPNDRMFSFYARTPAGFDYEFGWGAVEVDENWQVAEYDHISAWGHRSLI